MKISRNITSFVSILALGISAALILRAQEETATPVQSGTISPAGANDDVSGLSDLDVELKAVEMTTPTPAADVPQDGTFWSAQHAPGSAEEWPPLPGNWLSLPVWEVDTNLFLVDDLNYDYNAVAKTTLKARSGMSAMDLSPDDDGGSFSPMFSIADFSTNLWLEITNLSDNTAGLLVSNTVADIMYEVQSKANLTDTNWTSEGFFFGSEITNWTPTSAAATNYPNCFFRIRSWQDSDGSGLPDWWQLQNFGHIGVDPFADPDGDGWNNLQEFQNGTNPNSFDTPPPPQGLTATYNYGTSTATIKWLPSSGAVTGYILTMPSGTVTLSSNITSYADDDPNIATGLISDYDNYGSTSFQLQASYAAGDSASATANLQVNPPNIWLVEGAGGSNFLAVSALPPGTTAVRLLRDDTIADSYDNTSFDTSYDIPLTSFTNGLFYIPPGLTTAPVDGYVNPVTGNLNNNDYWFAQTLNASGVPNSYSKVLGQNSNTNVTYGIDGINPLFLDGRVQLKQNLIFLLRAATVDNSFGYYLGPASSSWESPRYYTANCAVADYYQDYDYFDEYNVAGFIPVAEEHYPPIPVELNVFQPFQDNFLYENCAFNASLLNHGELTTGVFPTGGLPSDDYMVFSNKQTYTFNPPITNGAPISALSPNSARWLMTGQHSFNSSYLDEIAIDAVDFAPTNFMLSGVSNIFGLSFLSTEIAASDSSGHTFTLNAGNSTTNTGWFYAETAQPELESVEYDFWNVNAGYSDIFGDWQNSDPLPEEGGFSPTNQSDHALVVPVGSSIQVAGYAKMAVLNGYSGVYGYLGQYFDKAYQINTNGIVTSTQTGVISPYGNFFATQPGPVALVTMPDPDTGARGTCTVYAVSLQLDANHDGNMDLNFGGADATSPSLPMQIWANNNYDRFKFDADDATNYQDDLGSVDVSRLPASQQVPDCEYTTNGFAAIPCTRDLEDYFRLWTPGLSAVMSIIPTNYTVQLSLSGSGQIRIFQATEASGGTNYLFNEVTASNQVANSTSLYMGLLASGSPLILSGQGNIGEHFIFCGAQIGNAQIDLQVLDQNQHIVADAPAYLQINDIKEMYERWTVGEAPASAPLNTARPAPDGVTTPFLYPTPQGTNTPYILFVHGWNLETWEKDRYAETAFKRLYWQSYQGRFGEFRWPTAFDFTGSLSDLVFDPKNYDNSEFNAWYSGYGLLSKLNDLNAEYPGNVYLMAHSMGNVVSGEALRLAGTNQVANTYIAMQGAVPAHCYDASATTRTIPSPFDSGTPNRYAHYYTDTSPDYFNSSASAGTYINFYNTNDYALGYWQTDQNLKPDTGFSYSGTNFFAGGSEIDFPSATYEIFAYCDEARCFALGAQANVGGAFAISKQVELDGSPYNFGSQHLYHSIEFRLDNPQNALFWSTLLSKMRLN